MSARDINGMTTLRAQASACTTTIYTGGGQAHKPGAVVVLLLPDSEGDEGASGSLAGTPFGRAVARPWSEPDDEDKDENCEVFLDEDGTERRQKPLWSAPVDPAVVTCTSGSELLPERRMSHNCNYCGAFNACICCKDCDYDLCEVWKGRKPPLLWRHGHRRRASNPRLRHAKRKRGLRRQKRKYLQRWALLTTIPVMMRTFGSNRDANEVIFA